MRRQYSGSKGAHSDTLERFLCFIEEDEIRGCWRWQGATKRGYGAFYLAHAKVVSAHRWAYEYFREPIPAGLQLDHLCGDRLCVHPWHLEIVTAKEHRKRHLLRPKRKKAKNAQDRFWRILIRKP